MKLTPSDLATALVVTLFLQLRLKARIRSDPLAVLHQQQRDWNKCQGYKGQKTVTPAIAQRSIQWIRAQG